MSSSSSIRSHKQTLAALASLGLALSSGTASAHVAVIRNSAKLQGNDYAVVKPTAGSTPVRGRTQRGAGMTTRTYGDKTVITFDRPVAGAGTYRSAVGGKPANASIQAYDKSGRQLKLWDEGTRRMRVTQWTTVRPGGKATTLMGVRSCCACIKQLVITRQTAPFRVAVFQRQPPPVAPPLRVASRVAGPLPYTVTPPPAAPPGVPIIPPAIIPAAAGGGGGGFFPLFLPLVFTRNHNKREFIPTVTPPIPPLSPVIPEPSAILLAVPGLVPLLALRRRKRRNPVIEAEAEA
jgi:hypothetical protein